MPTQLSLGAALYFDHDLPSEPAPIIQLLGALFGKSAPGELVQWFHRVDNERTTTGTRFELSALERTLRLGEMSTATVESPPETPDHDHVMVLAHTTPAAKLPSPQRQAWRYDLVVAVGPTWLERIGSERIVQQLVAFADTVAATAGVILWADSLRYASDLAWAIGGSSSLTAAQRSRVSDEMYWRSQWGKVARGPAWGTFLGAAHVERLGGIANLQRDASPARVISLDSGGVFIQASPIEAPIVSTTDAAEHPALAKLLAPVLGSR
jgi:hypothetical protein